MLGYDDVAIFLRVAREGSFVAAARGLGLPTSSVSRRVAALEARLNTQLLRRTTRAVGLTDDGRAFADRCAAAMDEIEAATRGLDLCNARLSGRLTVTAPYHVCNEDFAPHLLDFAAAHPDLIMDLRLTNGAPDLIEEGVDVAFQLAPLPDGRHVARKLWAAPYGVFASQVFLDRHPEAVGLDHPRRLARLPAIATPPINGWRFGETFTFGPRALGATVDDLSLGALAVRRGLGVGYLPKGLAGRFPDLVELTFGGGAWPIASCTPYIPLAARRRPRCAR
ncbi:MAG TPA: LysR family transcriptional regulator [Caulobacter sp.]|nr:LysR family transcriptional regulator [Caulobacter sp.]